MSTVEPLPATSRLSLHSVPWQSYVALRELPENYHVRLTYDRGTLEIRRPSKRHERFSYLIGRMIDVWTLERGIDIQSCRTVTFQREDLDRGLEPDNCYYVEHEADVRGRAELDLAIDPPPDLAIEVDLSPGGIDKLELFVSFGVPEVWRYDGRSLQYFVLAPDGHYQAATASRAFPELPAAEIQRVLHRVDAASETRLIRDFRAWVQSVR